ncbi:hypothetical protein C479_06087 [Halovivax asiaticus JCM 14624]|uniref:Uncharacterized protein n=1 Tax=Halovivax asiaticus JCM 14624 TaxID=1227490 RepID=M0BNF5_9EURY|nr:hypothetical protein [Halovivax asiaticus]ELZ11992.1 hypothetical protein C479_06087 [Halovivax asiaticus JCM 14624]
MTSDDDGVLDPDELTLDPDQVDRLDDNRFVVRADDSPEQLLGDSGASGMDAAGTGDGPGVDGAGLGTPTSDRKRSQTTPDPLADASHESGGTDRADASEEPREPTDVLAAHDAPHGVDISLKTDGEVARFQSTSHDIREVFADMMAWYATQLDEDVTPMEALEVLIATTDLDERA